MALGDFISVSLSETAMSLQLFRMDCLNGGPTLSTIPENMYWKQDIKNKVVFSEFFMLDFWVSSRGGMNLRIR